MRVKKRRDLIGGMKEKIYKLFLILMVSLSLGSGSLAQNEIRKLLEALSGTGDIQVVQELDEEEKQKESEEIRKKKSFLNYFQDILWIDIVYFQFNE